MRAQSILAGSLVAALAGVTLAASPCRADTIEATRYDIVEMSHIVDVRVDRGFATLVVQRKVANSGPKSDQATFRLALPETAVATRLRTAGVTAKGETVWFEGELMEAEAAAKKYEELTGIGGYYPKDPALLSWRSQGSLALQVFPVPAQSTKTVEYTLKMPLRYEHGAYRLELPAMGTEAMAALLRVTAVHPEDSVSVNDVASVAGAGGPIRVRAEKSITIELHARGVSAVDGVLASVPITSGKHLVRARIAAAPHLAEAPVGAHVVVLFDGSRSHHDAPAGLSAVRAYLGHMPGATVEFLTFDREVRAPIGRGLPVATALAKLAAFELEPRNGSRIDDALARADAILQASSASARRVVVVTDTLTRSELTPDKVGATSWKSGAIVHVAVVVNGGASMTRDDDSPWARLPRRTGGVFWNASAPGNVDSVARATFDEWARPKRIDKLVVRGLDATFSTSDVLEEGGGIEHFAIADVATARLELMGELWSRPTHTTVMPSAEQGKLAAALVFGSDLWSQLSEPEQMKLALAGGAVSPVTSYLAIEPGVRPSNEGLDWSAIGQGGGTGSGQGFGMGHGRLGGSHMARTVDKEAWLTTQLRSALRLCAPLGSEASAKLESTLDEVVEVGAVEVLPRRDAKVEACVREELWKIVLPTGTFEDPLESHSVTAKL